MTGSAPPSGQHRQGALQALLRNLTRAEIASMAGCVMLSLAAAFAGSLAALLLVPLVQPGHLPAFAGRLLRLPADVERLALYFAAVSVVFALLRWWAARVNARLASSHATRLRREVHAGLIGAPLSSLTEKSSAEIANVLTQNVELINQGFAASLQLLVAAVTSAVSLAFALWVSPVLTLALPVMLIFGVAASRLFGHEQSRISRGFIKDMTRLFWLSEDFPRRLRHVRSFGREDAEKAGYAEISARLSQAVRRQMELVAAGRLVLELLAAIGVAAVFVLAHRWRGVDSSAMIAVGLLLGRLLPYIGSSRHSFRQLQLAAPALELWRRYTALGEERLVAARSARNAAPGELHIERIRLSSPVPLEIQGMTLRPGELVLLRGDSGIGKSSLVDVLAGMIVPDAFAGRFGGKRLEFDDYRKLVRRGAYVSQGVRLWQRTLRECLAWAEPAATDAQLQQALQDVGFDSRPLATPEVLEATLGESPARLSGGELQRVLLAQVILRKPFLALLDESTNALDATSELAVLAALRRRLPDTILVVVSHRPGVSAIADQCIDLGSPRAWPMLDTVADSPSLSSSACIRS